MRTDGDVRRVFHTQRHAKMSGARLHGAPWVPTDGDSITSAGADGVSHVQHRRFSVFSADSLLRLSPK